MHLVLTIPHDQVSQFDAGRPYKIKGQKMKVFFDWHSADSRATGPQNIANTVVATYGTGGRKHADDRT